MPRVVCFGHVVLDVVTARFDGMPRRGLMGDMGPVTMHLGGGAGIVARALSQIGVDVALVAKVGHDDLGRLVRDDLLVRKADPYNSEAVGIYLLIDEVNNLSTSVSFVFTDKTAAKDKTAANNDADGIERTILHHEGASEALGPADLDHRLLQGCKVLYIGHFFALPNLHDQLPGKLEEVRTSFPDLQIVLDVAWDRKLEWFERLGPCLPYVDYLVPNEHEARALTGLGQDKYSLREVAEKLASYVNVAAVVKVGKYGAILAEKSGRQSYIEAFVAPEASPLGAGDCWTAGFIKGLLEDRRSLDLAVLYGNAVGAMCVGEYGATEGIRGYSKMLEFMRTHDRRLPDRATLAKLGFPFGGITVTNAPTESLGSAGTVPSDEATVSKETSPPAFPEQYYWVNDNGSPGILSTSDIDKRAAAQRNYYLWVDLVDGEWLIWGDPVRLSPQHRRFLSFVLKKLTRTHTSWVSLVDLMHEVWERSEIRDDVSDLHLVEVMLYRLRKKVGNQIDRLISKEPGEERWSLRADVPFFVVQDLLKEPPNARQ